MAAKQASGAAIAGAVMGTIAVVTIAGVTVVMAVPTWRKKVSGKLFGGAVGGE